MKKTYTVEFRGSAEVEAETAEEADDKFFDHEYEEITITAGIIVEK